MGGVSVSLLVTRFRFDVSLFVKSSRRGRHGSRFKHLPLLGHDRPFGDRSARPAGLAAQKLILTGPLLGKGIGFPGFTPVPVIVRLPVESRRAADDPLSWLLVEGLDGFKK